MYWEIWVFVAVMGIVVVGLCVIAVICIRDFDRRQVRHLDRPMWPHYCRRTQE